MKAEKYTIAMLITLIFAAANIQAQSVRRPVTEKNKERTKTTRPYKRETSATRVKNTQPAGKAEAGKSRSKQSGNIQYSRTARPADHKRPVNSNQEREVRHTNAAKNNGKSKRVYKPVSMTTDKNPRSNYRKPNKVSTVDTRYTAPVKSNIHHGREYYGGHHYHYAYPTKGVKIHYHHNTYVNRYHVLYYPAYGEIYWNRRMYRDYLRWYPGFHWNYSYGYRIQTISIWEAKYNLGEVAMVYGRVYASWYNRETDDLLLFFGGDYPYQQFTVVVPGSIARKFSWRPEKFFLGEHLTITGLITTYDGSPEIVIKNRGQLSLY